LTVLKRSFAFSASAEGCPELRHVLKGMRTVSNWGLPFQSIDEQTLKERQHLRTIPVLSYKHVMAQIIIGLDNIKISVPLEGREVEDDDLINVRCKLGWAEYGRQGPENDTSPSVLHFCYCTTVCGTRKLDEAMKVVQWSTQSLSKKPKHTSRDSIRTRRVDWIDPL